MTPAVLVIAIVLAALSGAWLTRPWWRNAAAPARMAVPIDTAPRSRALHLTVAAVALSAIAALAWWGIERSVHEPEVAASVSAAVPTAAAIAQVKATIERLQAQVQAQPDDAKAWETLGVSHAALGHHGEALQALRRAQQLRPDDATVLAETALSLVIADPKNASGEATALVARALALEPDNRKALALAGTLALQRHDYVQAVRHWEALARVEPADTPTGRQLQVGLAEARKRVALVAPRSASGASGKSGTAASPRISGTVSLAAGLRGKVEPDDTVFVYARSLDASGPPLAVVKRQVRDLPFGFTLDDSASMSGTRLSNAERVAVGARVSKSGQPVAHPGDLEGRIAPVVLGSADVKVEIDTVVPVKP
ncbi:MAG TPA: tetratricopeptide repeat protein [Caldimonas sp.]|nr:tetratricopeptide repeat protein [Caldimonas sp.]